MTVVAKFFVGAVERNEGTPTASQVRMGAVCRGRENRAWASATPGGSITLGILNERATDYFVEGQEYLVTFEKVAKPARGDGHAPIPVRGFGHDHDPAAPANVCEFCGVYARVGADGGLDWSAHVEHYGA